VRVPANTGRPMFWLLTSRSRHEEGAVLAAFALRVRTGPTLSSSYGPGRSQTLGDASYPTVAFRAPVMSLIAACSDSLTS